MTAAFRIPPLAQRRDARRPAYADLTLHLGDGRTVLMRIDTPSVQMEQGYDYDDVRSFGFDAGATLLTRSYPSTVQITLEGYLGDPHRDRQPAKTKPASPAVGLANPPTPGVGPPDLPVRELVVRTIAELPELADLVAE